LSDPSATPAAPRQTVATEWQVDAMQCSVTFTLHASMGNLLVNGAAAVNGTGMLASDPNGHLPPVSARIGFR